MLLLKSVDLDIVREAASKFLKLLVKRTIINIYIVTNDMINDHYSRRRQDAYVALKNYTTASPSAKT